MRKLKLYIAISLDGKIAGKRGEVDWLDEIPNPDKSDYGYNDFSHSVDTTIMGNSTYQEVVKLSGIFPYSKKTNYVLTRDQSLLGEGIPLFADHPKKQPLKLIQSETYSSGIVNLHYKKLEL